MKLSLICDGQQFNKANYYLSLQLIEHTKKTTIYYVRNLDPGTGQAQKCNGGWTS
jgi:hypothetical protein